MPVKKLQENSLAPGELAQRHAPERPDGDVPGRPRLIAKRPPLKKVAQAVLRMRQKQARYTNGTNRKTPYRMAVPERYLEYCDLVREQAGEGFSRYRALLALLDLGIATYESMENKPK